METKIIWPQHYREDAFPKAQVHLIVKSHAPTHTVPMKVCFFIRIFSERSRWAFPSGVIIRSALYPTNSQTLHENATIHAPQARISSIVGTPAVYCLPSAPRLRA